MEIVKSFKPQLLPNFGVGVIPEWGKILTNPSEWMVSYKYDGNRVEITNGKALGRSMKPIPSWHIQSMAEQMTKKYQLSNKNVVIEAEFYAPGFTFAEIQHFFKTRDVTSLENRKELEREWEKTKGGTDTYWAKRKIRDKSVDVEVSWGFPGRDVDWLCQWHPELKFYIFDAFSGDREETKLERYINITNTFHKYCPYQFPVLQYEFESIANLRKFYEYAISIGLEGLVLIKSNSKYKFGRFTTTQNQAFKMKNDNLEMDGVITDVLEGTKVKDGVGRTINELGYSVTSGKQDDREPNGMAKGFEVLLEDGQTTTVSLKGYTHGEKIGLLANAPKYIGRHIRFHAMAPVKDGGLPRHAHFTKGNFRENKN